MRPPNSIPSDQTRRDPDETKPLLSEKAKSVERLFPFVLKSRILLVGRDTLRRSKRKLHFVLITTDISEGSRAEILSDFSHYPVVQWYTSPELEKHFGINGAKVIGFAKSGLAQSIYAELKSHRLNQPTQAQPPDESAPFPPESRLLNNTESSFGHGA